MKFDVVISAPPHKSKTGAWDEHMKQHFRLIADQGYYGVLSSHSIKHPLVSNACKVFDTVMSAKYNDYIEGLLYPKRTDSMHCFIWKKV